MPINDITQTISELPPAGHRGVDVQTVFVIKQEDFQDHLQGTTVEELNIFKDQLNSRIGEINSTATTMNGYVSSASTSASTATTKAGEALTYRNQAETFKNEAETYRNQAETFKNEAETSATNAIQAITLDTIEDLATYTGTGLCMIKDPNRGGTFISKTVIEINPKTGSLYAVDNVTVFAKSGGGFWARQYESNIYLTWAGAVAYKTKAEAIAGVDSYFAFERCIRALNPSGGRIVMPNGYVKSLSTIKDDIYNTSLNGITIQLVGQVASEIDGEGTTILTQGAIIGIQFDGNRSGGRDFKIEGDNGAYDGTSHGIVSNASRAQWHNVISVKHRGDGFLYRFGNCSDFSNILCLSNRGNGFNPDGTGYVAKNGTPRPNDLNASTFKNIDCRANGLVGFRTGVNSGFSNWVTGLTVQANIGVGAEINGDYYSIFGFYGESNNAGGTGLDLLFTGTADYNRVYGRFTNVSLNWDDTSVNKRNSVDSDNLLVTTIRAEKIRLGELSSPVGYIELNGAGDGTNPAITLEGTSSTQTLDIKSSGAGQLGINPQFISRETVVAPTLLNSWVNYGGSRLVAGFYKTKEKIVFLEGVIKSGTATNPTVLFILPIGYRPPARVKFGLVSVGAFASVFIEATGEVYYESGSNLEFSLSGISFRVN